MSESNNQEKRKLATKKVAESFRSGAIEAIRNANDAQLTAIKTLFTLAGGGIALLSVYITGDYDNGRTAALFAVLSLFVSLVMGLFQLDSDKKFYTKHAKYMADALPSLDFYEINEDNKEIRDALEKMKDAPPPNGSEKYYYLQIIFFVLAAMIFFASYIPC
jgi:hypothetical protein